MRLCDAFDVFFRKATGKVPYPYQARYAKADELPNVLRVPTGAGKTAAIIGGWLWRRVGAPDADVRSRTPRRLVYCLPMRVLVEQTRDDAEEILKNLSRSDPRFADIKVTTVMGGEQDPEWMLDPEKEQILIGTQDMLLSGALNRGYGISRFRWPQAFALLNTDCLWAFDEVQLMGNSLPTSLQLDAFRREFKSYARSHSVWLSATLHAQWLKTPDSPVVDPKSIMELEQADRDHPVLKGRVQAKKELRKLDGTYLAMGKDFCRKAASQVLDAHRQGSRTLVILNRVAKAQEVYQELRKLVPEGPEVLLVHSRFRPQERAALNQKMRQRQVGGGEGKGQILVATQVVEAGVDITSETILTELSSWPSLVQRFGRCNRYGEVPVGCIGWWDVEEKDALPYEEEELALARDILDGLEGSETTSDSLPAIDQRVTHRHILRRADIGDLFDTSPDLSGNDVDVSRFIRESDGMDVGVFWREWEGDSPPPDFPPAGRQEICSVRLNDLQKFLKGERIAWYWDPLEGVWRRIHPGGLRPGLCIMLHPDQGGYSSELGWTGKKSDRPSLLEPKRELPEGTGSDPLTFVDSWQTLAEHTDRVAEELDRMLASLVLPDREAGALREAARWHDAGKAHEVFQETMRRCGDPPDPSEIWAKSPGNSCRHRQPFFRHELASALCYMLEGTDDLVAYLVAAHHGKVRLSIRSLPGEKPPEGVDPDVRIARGVWDGSQVHRADLGGGRVMPARTLSLGCLEMGQGSWLEKSLVLREEWGPFRLSFLETLLRVADARASM